MKTQTESASTYQPIITLPAVKQATLICPVCLLGIALIFWIKPSSGATVTGLAFWTVIMQAFSALLLVLVFRAAKSIGDFLDRRKSVQKILLPDKDLLEKAFRAGRYAPIDTRPHPEHLTDWQEHNKLVLQSLVASFEEHHIISPLLRGKVLESFHKGLSQLISSQPDGGNSFAVGKSEVQKMLDQVFPKI